MPPSQPAQPGYGGLAGSNPLCTKVSRVLPSEPSSSQLVDSLSANRRVALRPGSNSTNLAPPGSSSKPPIAKRPPTYGSMSTLAPNHLRNSSGWIIESNTSSGAASITTEARNSADVKSHLGVSSRPDR